MELRWTPYAVPFAQGFATAHGSQSVREGTIVRLRTNAGMTGAGEVAPLPSHGTATNAECLSTLETIAPNLLGAEVDGLMARVDALLGEDARHAPLRCAIEAAAFDATARAAGASLAAMLSPHVACHVAVNAVVDAAPCADAAAAAARAVADGFRGIKLKVGSAGSVAAEVARVAAVREAAGTDMKLRLDANGTWTEAHAIEMLRALEPYAIELMEQPVPAGDVAALARVRAAVRTPIAADESVTGLESLRTLIDARAVDAVVVKLPVVGGPGRAVEMARLSEAAGIDAIVTSALEGGIGVAAALHVAATLLQPERACGLATLALLRDDLIVEALPVLAGRMAVPDAPGIGATLDEGALARYASGPERAVRT